jgi:hypothetical protein
VPLAAYRKESSSSSGPLIDRQLLSMDAIAKPWQLPGYALKASLMEHVALMQRVAASLNSWFEQRHDGSGLVTQFELIKAVATHFNW